MQYFGHLLHYLLTCGDPLLLNTAYSCVYVSTYRFEENWHRDVLQARRQRGIPHVEYTVSCCRCCAAALSGSG